jgi:hypothetical protein
MNQDKITLKFVVTNSDQKGGNPTDDCNKCVFMNREYHACNINDDLFPCCKQDREDRKNGYWKVKKDGRKTTSRSKDKASD